MNLQEIKNNKTYAHVVPLATFMVLSMIFALIEENGLKLANEAAPWWRHWPEHWMYPLQTLTCLGLLIFFWKHYDFNWTKRGIIIGTIAGAIGIAFWILPTHLFTELGYTEETKGEVGWLKHFGLEPRFDGFNPSDLDNTAGVYISGFFRFLRAVVIVALVEEILWRGFLMRFLLNRDGNYWKVPFGKPSWLTYFVVTACFVFIHQSVDYAGAVVFGSIMYWVAVYTKSLGACVIMHAVANLLMGIYALQFGKYGLW